MTFTTESLFGYYILDLDFVSSGAGFGVAANPQSSTNFLIYN